ncbi:hypothetical protein JMY91_10270 [Brenneria goodwinii]|nr:hypothetical protein [Brenneria goodwinii]
MAAIALYNPHHLACVRWPAEKKAKKNLDKSVCGTLFYPGLAQKTLVASFALFLASQR